MLERANSSAADNGAVQHWEMVKAELRRETGEHNFRSWLANVSLRACAAGVLELGAPTRFTRDWVRTHYADRIRALWSRDFAPLARVEVVVDASDDAAPAASAEALVLPAAANDRPASDRPAAGEDTLSSPLDARCTFSTFVRGPANALAAAAAQQLADGLATFNPLCIHGGVGLGKTHLLQAAAAAARARNPGLRVVYMSAERFMYRFVQALRSKDTMTFKAACRSIDMLLVDDLQFVCGKEATQDEFLSALDALTGEGKPVLVAADRPPAELDGMSERLRSRLGGGLVVKVEAPDAALRLEILRSKRGLMKRDIPDDVLEFLSQRISLNVRALEGAFNRLVAQAELMGRAVTVDMAEGLLQDLLRTGERRIGIEDIQKKVAEHYGLRVADLLSPRRARPVARPRQVAMYLCKALTACSLPEIGRKFGGRDHTTIIHGVRKIEELLASDAEIARDVAALKRALEG